MRSKVYFQEEQKVDKGWVKFLMVGVAAASLLPIYYGLVMQLTTGKPWGDKPMSDAGLVIFSVFMTLIIAGAMFLVFSLKLKVKVLPDGIHINFFPFLKNRFISKDRIERYEIRKYKPIREYGGWGIRYSLKNGRAYNASGNIGMQLYLFGGKKILIGTNRPDAFKRALDKLLREYE